MAQTSQPTERVETVLYHEELTDTASVSYVRIHPLPRGHDRDLRDVWRYALRLKTTGRSAANILQIVGPDDDLPTGAVPENEFEFVEVNSNGKVLGAVYNDRGKDFEELDNPSAKKADIVIDDDGLVDVTLCFQEQPPKQYRLRPERYQLSAYPNPTTQIYPESPWESVPLD